jgi:hypothetical protein
LFEKGNSRCDDSDLAEFEASLINVQLPLQIFVFFRLALAARLPDSLFARQRRPVD